MNITNENQILSNSESEIFFELRRDAIDILKIAVIAVDPKVAIYKNLNITNGNLCVKEIEFDLNDFSRIFIVGGGKAGGQMAEAVEHLLKDRISCGYVNVLKGTENLHSLKRITLIGASHPIPKNDCINGVKKMFSLLRNLRREDLVIVLISGGGSSLMTFPAEGIELAEIQQVTKLLLLSGATINELNAVRKHMSAIKGGLMAKKAYPATIVSLILSDVVGNPLDIIASGPTSPDLSTFQDAVNTLKKYKIWNKTPKSIRSRLERGVAGKIEETPKPEDAIFEKVYNLVVGSNQTAAKAAHQRAIELGYNSMVLSTWIEGEAKEIGKVYASIAHEISETGNPLQKPAAVIAGGETTVNVVGSGKGGRNQELALSAALKMKGLSAVVASFATDGIDGPTDVAGAIIDGSTITRSEKKGLDAEAYLLDNNSYSFFNSIGDFFLTGPTETNVNDLSIILVK